MVQVLLTSFVTKQQPVRLGGGGCWTVFQKRLEGSVAFHRSWTDNKNGLLGLDRTGQDTPSDNNEKQAP